MDLKELFEEYMRYPAFANTLLSDVNQIGDFGDGPLHLASRRGCLAEMQVLLDNKADVGLRGEFQSTPLHGATLMGKLNAVKLLLKYGADPFAKDIDGRTCIDFARTNFEDEQSENNRKILFLLKENHK